MRFSRGVAIVALLLNLGVSVYLSGLVIYVLGALPAGTVIRPMGLFVHMFSVEIIAAILSVLLAVHCITSLPGKPPAYVLGLLTLLSGLIPFGVSMLVLNVVIELRSLILAD